MKRRSNLATLAFGLFPLWAPACVCDTDVLLSNGARAATEATPAAIWANRQVDTLLNGGPDTLRSLSEQLRALAIIDGGDAEAALPMDLRAEEIAVLWQRVRTKYETDWVRGYMVSNTRAAFVHTLASLHVRAIDPNLLEGMPGAFGSDADRWPGWLEAHKPKLVGR